MSNIKTSVLYDTPPTTKFDALMKEYEVAKEVADEIIAYYSPLADAAEHAKMLAILEQLEPIKKYATQLAKINGGVVTLDAYADNTKCFSVSGYRDGSTNITWSGAEGLRKVKVSLENLDANPHFFTGPDYNILGNWNNWRIYEQLETKACDMLKNAIKCAKNRGDKEIARFLNATDG